MQAAHAQADDFRQALPVAAARPQRSPGESLGRARRRLRHAPGALRPPTCPGSRVTASSYLARYARH